MIYDVMPREPVSTWTHAVGLILALGGTALLWHRGRHAPTSRRVCLVVFGACLTFCYAASTLYHGLHASAEGLDALDRLDRVGIFLLVAGSYTPIAWTLLRGRWRAATLAIVWLVAVVASSRVAIAGPFPPIFASGLYLAMGWGSIACYAELAKAVPHRDLLPLVVGGVLYSIGAAVNLIGWPAFWPGVFGPHELFHLFVIAGSLAHFRLMLDVVVPHAPDPAR